MEVKVHEKPSDAMVKQAAQEVTITDRRGRAIRLRKPGVLSQFRLVEAVGESAANQTYMGMVLPLIYVSAVDEYEHIPMAKKSEVEALIQLLDDDGVEAVVAGVLEHFGQADPAAEKAAIKK